MVIFTIIHDLFVVKAVKVNGGKQHYISVPLLALNIQEKRMQNR